MQPDPALPAHAAASLAVRQSRDVRRLSARGRYGPAPPAIRLPWSSLAPPIAAAGPMRSRGTLDAFTAILRQWIGLPMRVESRESESRCSTWSRRRALARWARLAVCGLESAHAPRARRLGAPPAPRVFAPPLPVFWRPPGAAGAVLPVLPPCFRAEVNDPPSGSTFRPMGVLLFSTFGRASVCFRSLCARAKAEAPSPESASIADLTSAMNR